MEQTSLQSAAENGNIARIYKKIFSLPEKMRQFIFDDSDLINNLFSFVVKVINIIVYLCSLLFNIVIVRFDN